jgi:hypothetical protein
VGSIPNPEVRGGVMSRLLGGDDVLLQNDKTPDVFEGVQCFHHLAQMVEPGIRLQHAAGKGTPVHGHDLAIFSALRIADSGHHEAHLQPSLPEGLRKLVGEEQRIAIAPLAEMVDSLIEAKPFWCRVSPIPRTEIESVGPGLQNDVTNNLLPGHSVPLGWSAVGREWVEKAAKLTASINKTCGVRYPIISVSEHGTVAAPPFAGASRNA